MLTESSKLNKLEHSDIRKLKSSKSTSVELISGGFVLRKNYKYLSLSKIIRINIFPRFGKSTDSYAIREISRHLIAREKLNGESSVYIPKLYGFSRKSRMGLMLEHSLYIEYLADSITLKDFLQMSQDEKTILDIFTKLSDFMLLMANKGVLHLDVQGGNILILKSGGIAVIDWEYVAFIDNIPVKDYFEYSLGCLFHVLALSESKLNRSVDDLILLCEKATRLELRSSEIFQQQLKRVVSPAKGHIYWRERMQKS